MGKAGGFFKRLKQKQKTQAKKGSRGTTGMKKADRILKHNAMVDINATKRRIFEMEAISSSDSDGGYDSDGGSNASSDDNIDFAGLAAGRTVGPSGGGLSSLDKLRSLIGASSAAPSKASKAVAAASNSSNTKKAGLSSTPIADDEDDEDAAMGDYDEDEDSLGDMEVDGNEDGDDVYDKMLMDGQGLDDDEELEELEEMEEGEEEEEEEGDYMIPEANWDDLFANVEGATGATGVSNSKKKAAPAINSKAAAADLKGKRGRDDDDDDGAFDEDSFDDADDEEEPDNEDEAPAADGGSEDEADAQEANAEALLPAFKLSAAEMRELKKIDASALGAAIVERDPWYARYYSPATANGSAAATSAIAKANPATVLADEDRPAFAAVASNGWEEPTLNPKTAAAVAVRGTPAGNAIVAALVREEAKASSSSSAANSSEGGVRPAFVHDVAWDLWCHYRAKLQHQSTLKAAAEANAKASNSTAKDAAAAAATKEAASASYLSAMSADEIAAAGLLQPHEAAFFRLLQSYGDVLDTSKAWDNTFSRRELTALHLVNHWLKTKTLLTAHNEVVARRRKALREKVAAKKKAMRDAAAAEANANEDGGAAASSSSPHGNKKNSHFNPKQKGLVVVSDSEDDEDAIDFRDQSFGKTRMMVMLPMRNTALECVESILRILYAKEIDDDHISENLAHTMGAEAAWHVDNDPYRLHRKATQGPNAGMDVAPRCEFFTKNKHVRKLDTFRGDFSEVEESLTLRTFRKRPEEFRQVFYGNMDDCFCFGMKLGLPPSATGSKKAGSGAQHTAMYSHVLNSDIIICSPLGLRKRLGKSGDVIVSLSSVEVAVVDHADVLVMQNWEHLQEVVKLLNERPRETTEGLAQISRLFEWAMKAQVTKTNALPVSPHGRRQNIVLSGLSHSVVQSTFRAMGTYEVEDTTAGPADDDFATLFKASAFIVAPAAHTGVIAKVPIPVRQHFLRYDASSISASDDERFNYFTQTLYPARIQSLVDREVRTILFVPSYFDYVRLRNHFFAEQRDLTAFLSEYSTEKQQRQVLGQFTDMERPFLIMTERFYYFKRYFVRLAEQLIFYSPPLHASYYPTLIGKLNADSPNTAVMLIYGRYDTHELVRVAGTERAKQLLERAASSFAFVTNGGVM